MNLTEKKIQIRDKVHGLKKEMRHYQKFEYYGIEQIKDIFSELFREFNIDLKADQVSCVSTGNREFIIGYKYTLINGDDVSEREESTWFQIASMDQKENFNPLAHGGANSYALKNWLISAFLITDRDEYDFESEYDGIQNQAPKGNGKITQMPQQQKPVTKSEVKDIPSPPKENKQPEQKSEQSEVNFTAQKRDEFLAWAKNEYGMERSDVKAFMDSNGFGTFNSNSIDAYKDEIGKHFTAIQKEKEWEMEAAAQGIEIAEDAAMNDPFSEEDLAPDPQYNAFTL